MKLRRLAVRNFKSLRDVSLALDPELTILVGRNDAGKSNILDAMIFLGQMVSSSWTDAVRNRGGSEALVFAGDYPSLDDMVITTELEFNLAEIRHLHLMTTPSFPWEKFQEAWQPNWTYEVHFGWRRDSGFPRGDFTLLSEEVWTRVRRKIVEYAKASWRIHGTSGEMYFSELVEDVNGGVSKDSWKLKVDGGRSPATCLLQAGLDSPEWTPIRLISAYLKNIVKLDAVRVSPESIRLLGKYKLGSDASDLPQVLHSIASSRRQVFNDIVADATTLLPELSDIRSPAKEGADTTYLSVTQKNWPEEEFRWGSVASGTKEVIYLLTFLHVAPENNLLLIEEPEIHLHPQAISKLREILFQRAAKQRKQLIITTHSTTLIDDLPFEKILYVTREGGVTQALGVGSYEDVERLLSYAQIPKSSLLAPESRIFILVVEGRDDAKVWRQFLSRGGINLSSPRVKIVSGMKEGGLDEVISALIFLERLGDPVEGFGIVDANGSGASKRERMKAAGLLERRFHVLLKGEIEDYLMDSYAIAALVNRSRSDVEEVLEQTKGRGKPRLDKVLKRLGISSVSAEVKELLARHLRSLDPEILEVVNEVASRLEPAKRVQHQT